MSPTFMFGPDRIAVLGTKGGSRIITSTMIGILGFDAGLDSPEVVALPRYHHQYLPDTILEEPGTLSAATRQALAAMGHTTTPDTSILVLTHAVDWDRRDDAMHAGADPRNPVGEGKVMVMP
jgi:gamma-glutamyltranspeptidase/glutathione hydrolase